LTRNRQANAVLTIGTRIVAGVVSDVKKKKQTNSNNNKRNKHPHPNKTSLKLPQQVTVLGVKSNHYGKYAVFERSGETYQAR